MQESPNDSRIKIPRKRGNLDEIVFFSAGSENSSVLSVHEFSGSVEKAKYR